jgi:hypothetical protein
MNNLSAPAVDHFRIAGGDKPCRSAWAMIEMRPTRRTPPSSRQSAVSATVVRRPPDLDGAAHGQPADVAAGEEQRAHHVRVSREGEQLAAELQHLGIIEVTRRGGAQRREEQARQQITAQPAARAMPQHDAVAGRERHRA